MKKIVSIVLILIVALSLSTVSYAASSSLKISMSPDSSNLRTERKILLNIGLKEFENITTSKPMASQGTLVYNDELFKSVTATGKNGWTATLSGKNFVLDTTSVEEGKTIVTFTLTLKDDIEIPSIATFSVKNFSITNDDEIDYENLTIGEVSVTTTQNTSEGESEGQGTTTNSSEQQNNNSSNNESNNGEGNTTTNQGSNQTTGNTSTDEQASSGEVPSNSNVRYEITTDGTNTSSSQSQSTNNASSSSSNSSNKIDKVDDLTTTKESKIPQTGETEVLISIIAILAIAGIAIFIRYRSIEIKAR